MRLFEASNARNSNTSGGASGARRGFRGTARHGATIEDVRKLVYGRPECS